jgi:hypothetical protein
MELLENLRTLYGAFLRDAAEAEATRRPWEGLGGFGGNAAADARQDAFHRDVRGAVEAAADAGLSSGEAEAALGFMLGAPEAYPDAGRARWMLIAVQGTALPAADALEAPAAARLAGELRARFPRRSRLPVQETLLRALDKRASG